MHDNGYALETLIRFDALGQHITVHFRHFRINKNQADVVTNISPHLLSMRSYPLKTSPFFSSISRMLVANPQLVQNLGYLSTSDNRIIDKKYAGFRVYARRGNIDNHRLAKGIR